MKIGDTAGISDRWFPGRAKGTEEVNLAFRVSGEIDSLPIDVGDQVKQGQLLATLDARDYQAELQRIEASSARASAEFEAMKIARPEEIRRLEAEVRRAKADNEYAVAEHDRTKQLFDKDVVTKSEMDRMIAARDRSKALLDESQEALTIAQAGARKEDLAAKQAEIKSLNSEVQVARNNLEYTKLVAPFDGTIVTKYVDNFQTASAQQFVCRLLNSARIEIIVDIPEDRISMAPYISDLVVVFDAFPELEITAAEIKEVGTEASELTRTYPVTVILDQPDPETGVRILPGMAGRVRGTATLPDQIEEEGFEVPDSAVFSDDQGQRFVWSIDEKQMAVHRQPVSAVALTPIGMRVTGVTTDQWIVTAGVHYLEEGQTVRLMQESGEDQP